MCNEMIIVYDIMNIILLKFNPTLGTLLLVSHKEKFRRLVLKLLKTFFDQAPSIVGVLLKTWRS